MYVLLEPWTLELIQDAGAGSGFSTEGSHRTPFQLRLNELALILPRGGGGVGLPYETDGDARQKF